MAAVACSDIFTEMRDLLEQQRDKMSATATQRAKMTIDQIELIQMNLDKISQLETDEQKNKYIHHLTSAGAESGFSTTNQALLERISLFTYTFLQARKQDDATGFFSCFTKGDPCLNGRMESLAKYAASLNGIDLDNMADPEEQNILPISVFSEVLMEEEFEQDIKTGTLTKDAFEKYVIEHLEVVAQHFKAFENRSSGKAFIQLLKAEGIVTVDVEWQTVLKKFMASSLYFDSVFRQALTLASELS